MSGISLNILVLKQKIFVKKECLDKAKFSKLTKNFIHEYEALPKFINKPWVSLSWQAYKKFLDKFASHIILSVKSGTSIKQMAFIQSSKSYSERDFQIKSWVSLAGPSSVGKVHVEACANVSETEKNRVRNMNTQEKLFVLGGTKKTRNALNKKITDRETNERSSWVRRGCRVHLHINLGRFTKPFRLWNRQLHQSCKLAKLLSWLLELWLPRVAEHSTSMQWKASLLSTIQLHQIFQARIPWILLHSG